jgi:hypothetical protein
MSNANRVLPNLEALNPTELKALIVSQHELIVSRDSEIEQLKLLIAKLRRMQFGRSSEKLECAFQRFECDRVTSPNITQRSKESVAMAGQGDAAQAARHGRLDDMSDRAPQDLGRISLYNHCLKSQPRDLQFANNVALDYMTWLDTTN